MRSRLRKHALAIAIGGCVIAVLRSRYWQDEAARERRLRCLELARARRLRHDLRSPLAVARGYLELIQLRAADPSIREDARIAISELDRVAALVTDPEGPSR
jgi:signal transduction histidine kinase